MSDSKEVFRSLASFETVAYIKSAENYGLFLDILKQKNMEVFITGDIQLITDRLLSCSNMAVVFIDDSLAGKITEELSLLLSLNNYICVLLVGEYTEDIRREPYIYDIVECKNKLNIDNFFIRLEKYMECKSQYKLMELEMKRFYDSAMELSAEKNIENALELFVETCMDMTSSDAGTVYVVVDAKNNRWSAYDGDTKNRFLKFAIAKNKSMDLNLDSTVAPISRESIFGYTVVTGDPLRIDDAYCIPRSADYQFNTGFDIITGYKTKSILTIPMKDHHNRVLGVIQLINKISSDSIVPFTLKDETVVYSLAGHAAVVLENNMLYEGMDYLLEEYRLTIFKEVAKRKQAEEQINKLLTAVEHSPASVIITDADGKIEYVNPQFTSITGYTFEEAAGKTPGIVKSGTHTEGFYRELWDTIRSGREWHGKFSNRKKNGELFKVSSCISPIKDGSGEVKYFVSVNEDL